MNKIFFLASLLLASINASSQFIILPAVDSNIIRSNLADKSSGYKALTVNFKQKLPASELLIFIIVFSDEKGNFKTKTILKDSLNSTKTLYDLIPIAEKNVTLDENREISHFEYEGQYSKNPIRLNDHKLIIENKDRSYTLYENFSYIHFFEIRPFKQFTVVQSCASLINIMSIIQPMKREYDKDNNYVVVFPNENEPGNYFPNKLFLEKINADSSYHFVKFRELCMDCVDNDTYEFDFNNQIGIVRYMNYLPRQLSRKKLYLKLE